MKNRNTYRVHRPRSHRPRLSSVIAAVIITVAAFGWIVHAVAGMMP